VIGTSLIIILIAIIIARGSRLFLCSLRGGSPSHTLKNPDVEEQEDVSECEDHISENSKSDSDFEEEDEIEHQLVTKKRRATGPAGQQAKIRVALSFINVI